MSEVELLDVPGIPAPTGPYRVGCTDVMTKSGLLVRLFYPTHVDYNGNGYEYARARPHPNYTIASFRIFGFQPVDWMTLLVNNLTDAKVPALLNAPLYSTDHAPLHSTGHAPLYSTDHACIMFPVIVFSHGLHGYRAIYSGICTELASNGYVIAAVEHKDGSACTTFHRVPPTGVFEGDYDRYVNEWIHETMTELNDFPLRNKQLSQRKNEVSETLDLLISLNNGDKIDNLMGGVFDLGQFSGHLDTHSAAIMGHSFGGATTVVTMTTDARFKCGVAMDTWMFPVGSEVYRSGVRQPLLFINSSQFQWPDNVANMMRLTTPPNELRGDISSRISLVTLKNTTHYNQCDIGFTLPVSINAVYRKTDVFQTHSTNIQLCMAFLRRYLNKEPDYQEHVPLLDGGSRCSEHVLYGTNIDWENATVNRKGPTREQSKL